MGSRFFSLFSFGFTVFLEMQVFELFEIIETIGGIFFGF